MLGWLGVDGSACGELAASASKGEWIQAGISVREDYEACMNHQWLLIHNARHTLPWHLDGDFHLVELDTACDRPAT